MSKVGTRQSHRKIHRVLFCLMVGLRWSADMSRESTPFVGRLKSTIPESVRQALRHRPGVVSVRPELLLMGCQDGFDSIAFAEAIGSTQFEITTMDKSPHVALLQTSIRAHRDLTDEELQHSQYWEFAQLITKVSGEYFGAQSNEEVLKVTRNFIDWGLQASPRVTELGKSAMDETRVLVARIKGSSRFQIVDGHHRVAVAIIRGDKVIQVHQTWLGVDSPWQSAQ